MTIGYHASHEQFTPSDLLKYAILAEQAGFKAIHSSDHFHPWSERQGNSGFSYAWMGAAMQATTLPFSAICIPGQRYHPTIVAQAIATLSQMFPGRFTAELGSGEAINETITGEPWPAKQVRNERLKECAGIISKLLDGALVTHNGLVTVKHAKLYTIPPIKPKLLCAAITPETAGWAGAWADGLITVGNNIDTAEKVINAFKNSGGKGKPIFIKLDLSYAKTKQEALDGAYHQWRNNVLSPAQLADFTKVEEFDKAGENTPFDAMQEKVKVAADISEIKDWLLSFEPLQADRLVLHNVNRTQEMFIKDFGEKVLPFLPQ